MAGFEPAFPPWRGGYLNQTNPHPHIGIMIPYACISMKCNSWLRWTDGIRTRSQSPVPEPQSGATNQIRLCPHGWAWTQHDYNAFISSGLKNRNQRIAILSCNALCSMHTWWHPNDSGEFLSRDDADRTRYLLYPKQVDYQFSLIPLYFNNHITIMYACQHLHTLTRDMSRWLVTLQRLCFTRTLFCFWTTPALMPIPSNSTGHQLWYHRFIPLTGETTSLQCLHCHHGFFHVVMISCPEWNSNPWPFDSESNALSTELSGQKAASRIGLYLQWTRKWKHCLHPTGSYHEFGHQPAD